jgi:hypothetical protein
VRPLGDPAAAQAAFDWLATLDHDPATLHAYLARNPSRRLGLYAEQLLLYYIENHSGARLIAANRQLQIGGRTWGECDCLLETQDGRRLHWELAVKYYLRVDSSAADAAEPLAGYVGPNLADRFDLKLAHLLERQLPLSSRPEFAALFPGAAWQAQMLVRGWLFYRPSAQVLPGCAAALEPTHLRGWWLTCDEWLAQRQTFAADAWAFLPRLSWLAPARLAAGGITAAAMFEADLRQRFSQAAGPELVVALRRTANGYDELSRGFVVDATWPARAPILAAALQH